jgi:hypothetical protein
MGSTDCCPPSSVGSCVDPIEGCWRIEADRNSGGRDSRFGRGRLDVEPIGSQRES